MNRRQAYALHHPLNRADITAADLAPYQQMQRHTNGLLILTTLAVDR